MKKKRVVKRRKIVSKSRKQGASIHQGSFKLVCPKHRNEQIYRMYYNVTLKVKKRSNGREFQGSHITTNWFYCGKCNRAYNVKYTVSK